MKRALVMAAIMVALGSVWAFGHHNAEGTIDEEIYAQIDEMVADTPHADLTFDDMGSPDTTITTITTDNVRTLETLISRGLLSSAAMLDGDTSINIEFGRRGSATMIIVQME